MMQTVKFAKTRLVRFDVGRVYTYTNRYCINGISTRRVGVYGKGKRHGFC